MDNQNELNVQQKNGTRVRCKSDKFYKGHKVDWLLREQLWTTGKKSLSYLQTPEGKV